MKVLKATDQVDPRDRGFSYTVPGELLYLGLVCDRDMNDPDAEDACGCGWAFAGVASQKGTTLALVADSSLTRRQYINLIAESLADVWGLPKRHGRPMASELADTADFFNLGDTLVRRVDDIALLSAREAQ